MNLGGFGELCEADCEAKSERSLGLSDARVVRQVHYFRNAVTRQVPHSTCSIGEEMAQAYEKAIYHSSSSRTDGEFERWSFFCFSQKDTRAARRVQQSQESANRCFGIALHQDAKKFPRRLLGIWRVESRTGAVALASRWRIGSGFRPAHLNPVWPGSVSCSRSSNQDWQISRIRLSEKTHAVAPGRFAVRCGNRTNPNTE